MASRPVVGLSPCSGWSETLLGRCRANHSLRSLLGPLIRACLQVLLSQVHRLRALVLLARFLDMGAWAADLALSTGIYPYVLKLLQTTAAELRPILVFIWAKILASDPSCQVGLPLHDLHLSVLS